MTSTVEHESINELLKMVSNLKVDYGSYITELQYLREIVYKQVQHVSEKAFGDYAEIAFTVSKKYIRRCGIYIFMSDLMAVCVKYLQDNDSIKMIPSLNTDNDIDSEKYVITLLCVSSCDTNFSSLATDIANLFEIEEKVILFVEKQINVIERYENCRNAFEVEFGNYIEDTRPVYFEITNKGDCLIQYKHMELNKCELFDICYI